MGYRGVVGTLSAALIVAGVGQAVPAHASVIVDNAVGTYNLAYRGKDSGSKWVLSPCENNLPNCINVRQFAITDNKMKTAQFTSDAYWNVGSWTTTADSRNILNCKEDGSKHTRPTTFAWDGATGEGWRSYTDPGICGDKPQAFNTPFELKKIDSVLVPLNPAPPAPAPAPPAPAPPAAPAPAAAAAPEVPAVPAPGAAEAPEMPAPPAAPAA